MAQFNLEEYETVASRITRFYEAFPEGRIITDNLTTTEDRTQGVWIVKTSIYLTLEEQVAGCPKATGLAFEVDGQGMANKTSALENCETSSIGRCLANLGMSGDLRGNAETRPSREEMEKVQRGAGPQRGTATVPVDFLQKIVQTTTIDELNLLWEEADRGNFSGAVRADFTKRKSQLMDGAE